VRSLPHQARPIQLQGWLVVALVATSATQLRISGLPVGPGEIGLVAWMAVASAATLLAWGMAWRLPLGFWPVAAFWIAILPLVWLGFLRASAAGLNEESGADRDMLAILFVAVFAVVLSAHLSTAAAARTLLRGYSIAAAVTLLALLVVAIPLRRIGPFELWYEIVRFVGLATNPNQLALFVAPIPFLVAQALADDRSLSGFRCFLVAGAAFVVGIATTSDALLAAWVACVGAMATWWWVRSLNMAHRSPWKLLFLLVVLPALAAGFLFAVGPSVYEVLERKLVSLIDFGSQASVRLTLWSHGVDALAQSPLFGWGPGAHSGMAGPFGAMESHNTYVDWATISGLFGVAALVALLVNVLWRCVNANKPYLALAVTSLASFAAFHYVLRQPVFWFVLVSILAWSREDSTCAA